MSEQVPSSSASQPTAAPAHVPGMAQVRIELARLRTALVLVLLVLVVALAGMGAWVFSLQSRLDDVAASAAAAAAVPAAAAPAPAVTAAPAPAAPAPAVTSSAAPIAADVVRPAGVDAAGAFVIGDPNATDVVEVYVDYQCPFCQRWEAQLGRALVKRALEPGSGLQVRQYSLAFLGEASRSLTPPGASARAAAAAACVMDGEGAEAFARYTTDVFAKADPSEPPAQFQPEELLAWAQAQGISDATAACIESQRFVPFIAASTQNMASRGVNGTPTVFVNGVELDNPFEDPALDALLKTPVMS